METAQSGEEKISYEKVLSLIQDLVKENKLRQEEADRRQEEADRQMKERAERLREESAGRKEEEEQRKKEFDRQMKERAERLREESERRKEEFDRQMKEREEKLKKEEDKKNKEFERQKKEFDRRMKERDKRLDKQFSRWGNQLGEIVEYMVMPALPKKFKKLGLEFYKAYPNAEIIDRENDIITEVDITLENSEKVMIVEVKSKPTTIDVKEHIQRMHKIRRYADLRGDKRVLLGAVAGMVFKENVKQYVHKNGFYLIEPSGESFAITAPPEPAEY